MSLSKELHRTDEVQAPFFLHVGQDVARGSASKTVIDLFVRRHTKAGAAIIVKGAFGLVVWPGFFKRDVFTDQTDQVTGVHQLINKVLGNLSGHGASVSAQARFDLPAEASHVGAPGHLRFEPSHYRTHLRHAAGARFGDRLINQGSQLVIRQG